MSLSRVRQRRFGGPDARIQEQGDCWATAVVCYTGLSERDRNELHRRIVLSDLAQHRHGKNPQEGGAWWNVTMRFLAQHGKPSLGWAYQKHWGDLDGKAVYIASGPSPRGDFDHSLLAFGDGTVVWDPHPSDDGLTEITEWAGWWEPTREAIYGDRVED